MGIDSGTGDDPNGVAAEMLRRSFLMEVRAIDKLLKRRNIDPILREYFEVVRRSRLQTVRDIERSEKRKRK